jgi:hypothetical protein
MLTCITYAVARSDSHNPNPNPHHPGSRPTKVLTLNLILSKPNPKPKPYLKPDWNPNPTAKPNVAHILILIQTLILFLTRILDFDFAKLSCKSSNAHYK